jgi:pimeloyl-ACP methyl ester carboxylesterase
MTLPTLERRDIHSFDGTRLEVQTFGRGDLVMVIANGLGGTLLAWAPLLRALEDRVRFVSWDYRGLYRSGRPALPEHLRVAHHVADLAAVMDATGTERAVLAGWSMGVQVCLQATEDMPERVRGLVLVNGTYGRIFDTAFRHAIWRHLLPALTRVGMRCAPVLPPLVGAITDQPWFLPLMARLRLIDRNLDREVFLAIARGFRDLDFGLYLRILAHVHEHDGEPLLERIRVPLLLVCGQRDAMTPSSVRHVFEKHVRHAEVFLVPNGTHYSLIEYPDMVCNRVRNFLDEHFGAAALARRA